MSGMYNLLKQSFHIFKNYEFLFQSQPCHWRNLKTVVKRDVSNQTLTLDSNSTATEERKEAPLSDNISLFQSLRVLQEGEGEEFSEIRSKMELDPVCLDMFIICHILYF